MTIVNFQKAKFKTRSVPFDPLTASIGAQGRLCTLGTSSGLKAALRSK
jgi:hypothetical protein